MMLGDRNGTNGAKQGKRVYPNYVKFEKSNNTYLMRYVYWDEKNRDTFRGFFAQLMGAGMNNLPVWRIYESTCYEAGMLLDKILPIKVFRTLMKHFRFASPKNLPKKGEKGHHPLQNILSGIQFVKQQSQLLWDAGLCTFFFLCFSKLCFLSSLHWWRSLCKQVLAKRPQD